MLNYPSLEHFEFTIILFITIILLSLIIASKGPEVPFKEKTRTAIIVDRVIKAKPKDPNYFLGEIKDVSVYSYELTEDEIVEIFDDENNEIYKELNKQGDENVQ